MRKGLILLFIMILTLIPVTSISQDDGSISQNAIPASAFVSTWDTQYISGDSSDFNQVKLPLVSGGNYFFVVDWGDGTANDTIIASDQVEVTHTYASEGQYQIIMDGIIEGFSFSSLNSDRLKIMEISQWGDLKLGDTGHFFDGCENLVLTATDAPDLSDSPDLSNMFRHCINLGSQGTMDLWDVSGVTNMEGMFEQAQNFNMDLSSWDVSSVTNMDKMFSEAQIFNFDISSWDVSSVTSMSNMFSQALRFNQPIGSWDVSAVTDLSYMFSQASSFNQNISAWDVSSVKTMRNQFYYAVAFNQDISSWNVELVEDMTLMIYQTSFSVHHYDLLLNSWSLLNLTHNVRLDVYVRYSYLSKDARASIISNFTWTIVDLGYEWDKDGDFIDDLYELEHGLDPTIDDGEEDLDHDGMPNNYEYWNGLNLQVNDANLDKDQDGMPNLWEYRNGLQAGLNDATLDRDRDGMPNLYEYQNGLRANENDANLDKDLDGMPNLYEYLNGLLAGTYDADDDLDGDGMPNYYEYLNGLDPQVNDANEDLDGDWIRNIDEYENGTRANSKDRTFLNFYIFIILGLLLVFGGSAFIYMKQTSFTQRGFTTKEEFVEAKSRGFKTKADLQEAETAGFNTADEYKRCKKAGFDSKEEFEHALSLGFDTRVSFDEAKAAGFSNKTEADQVRSLGFSTMSQKQEAESLGFSTMAEWDEAKSLGYNSKDAMREGIEQELAKLQQTVDNFEPLDSQLNEILSLTPSIEMDNPSPEDVEEVLKSLRNRVASFKPQIMTIPDDTRPIYAFDSRFASILSKIEQYKADALKKLSQRDEELAKMSPRLHSQAMTKRRSFKLNRILNRVEMMTLAEFAKELEYDNVESIKHWLLYEAGDDVPIRLNGDNVTIAKPADSDIGAAIDDMLDQFKSMEDDKIGKIE
ncbi:MAG: DUF285 domain-containing protein [Candidatus Heimdallarchaeota archaeon]|nr:DUF285 domain-containing protein [Candidatus Heimdallarchaeota archaeon]